MAKPNQRFDYARLAEALQEKGMVDPTVLRELLTQAQSHGGGFTEALVLSGYVADWDLSRVVCETFQLPFLPVGVFDPDTKALENLDKQFLLQHALVPVARFGQVLTVSMPALVPAEVLGMLAAENDLVVLPVVGTAQSNRNWVEANLVEKPERGQADAWSSIFDAGEAAVMDAIQDAQEKEEDIEVEAAGLEFEEAQADELEVSVGGDDSDNELPGLAADLEDVGELGGGSALDIDDIDPPLRSKPTTTLPPAPKF